MYPYNILTQSTEPGCILSKNMGPPLIFDYTDPLFGELPIRNTQFMQQWTMNILEKSGKKWGIAGYLENRSLRLQGTHLIDEGRVYHLGIDIIAPANTPIFSPLNGEVIESTVELGKANYGGYVVTKHLAGDDNFYILYGHLDPTNLIPIGNIQVGDSIGNIGSPEVNGDWTTHLHMQVLTEAGLKNWKSKGYCALSDLPIINKYCPDPSFLLRY